METHSFRPPQFSDDVAWLPAWLQPNQPTPASEDVPNQDPFRHSLQNVDPFEGETGPFIESIVLNNGQGKSNNFQLYLSGDESTPLTMTPSCEKVFHFKLHLSIGETSPIISSPLFDVSQDDKCNFIPALVDSTRNSLCYMDHDSKKMNIFSSREKVSGCSGDQTPLHSDPGRNTLEMSNQKCTECNDIGDAVELSVAASEALVIHEIVADGLPSAILEVALQVKKARLNGNKDSSCCCNDFDEIAEILSDLADSDMEDAYNDVGLCISSLANISFRETSISRVQETPMSQNPGRECELLGDQEINLNKNFLMEPQQNNFETSILKDLSDHKRLENVLENPSVDNQLQINNLDCQQTLQEENNGMSSVDGLPYELEVNPSPQSHHIRKVRLDSTSTRHSNYVGINKVINSSHRFKSRWFGGWTGMERDLSGEIDSIGKYRKNICNLFVRETSYLSESMDIVSDQNSAVHNNIHASNALESGKYEDLRNAASEGALISQVAAESSSSFVDPLCSMVPCSISAEIGDTVVPINYSDVHQVLDAFQTHTSTRIPTKSLQLIYGDKDENLSRDEHVDLKSHDVVAPVVRTLTSLRTYSIGLPGISDFSFKRSDSCEFVNSGEYDARDFSNSAKSNEKDTSHTIKQPPDNMENELMRPYSVEELIGCPNTSEKKDFEKQTPANSVFGSTSAIYTKANHVEDACGTPAKDDFERIAENVGQMHAHLEEIPASPLSLCHRTRRFKVPKLHADEVATINIVEHQDPVSDTICQDISKRCPDQVRNLSTSKMPPRKRVRFSEVDSKLEFSRGHRLNLRKIGTCKNYSSCRSGDRLENCNQEQGTSSQDVKERLTKCCLKDRKRTIFRGLEFLLTGFSKKKENEIEGLLRKHGGTVLSNIPPPPPHPRRKSSRSNPERLPVVLSTKKLQTTRFLYGCSVNAFLLKVDWAHDSIRAGSVLPPDKYLVLSNKSSRILNQVGNSICQNDNDYVFDKVGIMLHGTHNFCTKLAKVIKHGRGYVYKSLQWLVQSLEKNKISLGAVVAEDLNRATRHLKKYASEQKIPVVPARWVINSLLKGTLLPVWENHLPLNKQATRDPELSGLQEWSQEI
ncbi:unnamed protein product [Amaranthus hypochondriacus]